MFECLECVQTFFVIYSIITIIGNNSGASFPKAPAKGKRGRAASKEPKVKPPPKAKPPPKPKPEPKAKPGPKPKKAKLDKGATEGVDGQEKIDETFKKVRRKVDRFKGMSEEEVMSRTLPDILKDNLDYVIVSGKYLNG